MSVCVVMCRQVVYVSVGSRKIVFLCVGMCRHVSAGCLCVGRFKKIVLLCVGVCRHVSAGCLCVGRFKKNCVVVCRCITPFIISHLILF